MNREHHTDAALTAKVIKKRLKAIYPDTKFSVTSDNFSMGDSVDIRWTDGPKSETIDAITRRYQQGSFDGMTDCYNYSSIEPELGCPGAKYVMVHRTMSDEFKRALEKKASEVYGDFDVNDYQSYWHKINEVEEKYFPEPEPKPEVSARSTKGSLGAELEYKVVEDVDTRDNSQIYVVRVVTKVEDFSALREQMKGLGGYYSKFKKGFIFKSDPTKDLASLGVVNSAVAEPKEAEEPEVSAGMSLLAKFNTVEIENTSRIAQSDTEYCEAQQALYANVLRHLRAMFEKLQGIRCAEEEFYASVESDNCYYSGTYKHQIYEYKFVDVSKEGFSQTIEKTHKRFISQINDYFRKKYNVTIEDKEYNAYLRLEKPKSPKDYSYGYSRMTDDEIAEYKNKQKIYENVYDVYLDGIINAELHYDAIIDDIFVALDGFSFGEKADKEIRDAAIAAVSNRWNNNMNYSVKNGKISFDILSSYKCSIFNRYRVRLDNDGYRSILKALAYYDSDQKYTEIYGGWLSFTGYQREEPDGIYDTHEVYGYKVSHFKYFKNGKFEVTFTNHANALRFAKEFLGYTEQAA